MMVVAQRYDRQTRIEGWNQGLLEKSMLTIVGNNTFSEYLALAGSALGIGTVRLIATPYDGESLEAPLLRLSKRKGRGQRLAEMVENVGNANLEYLHANMRSRAEDFFLRDSDAVVDATGRHESRALALNYASNGRHCEVANFYNEGFSLINQSENPLVLYEKASHRTDPVNAMIAAGAALEEVKKAVFKKTEKRECSYACPNRDSNERYSGLRVLVVGAGALGNFVVSGLAALGLDEIDIMDPDTIEETNLNRQLLFYSAVGDHKARVLAERCKAINKAKYRAIVYRAIVDRFEKGSSLAGYDIVFDCVDNFETRALLSKKCVEAGIPLISGGTSYTAGQAVAYGPGKTSCPNHVLDLEGIAEKQKTEREPARCILEPDPSVIMSNQVTAGMMLNGMRRLLYPEIFGPPVNGQSRYDAKGPHRFGAIELKEQCGD